MKVPSVRAGMIVLLVAIAVAAWAASAPLVQQMLPAKDSVKGFGVFPNSLQYGKGDDIAKIYNGGYELYTKNGVIDAARQMYQRKNDYVEVTLHTMKSDKAALDFLKYWQKQNKVKALTKSGKSTGFLVTKPSVTSYTVTGKYLTTISAFHPADRAAADARAFAAATEKSIIKATKGKK